VDDIRALESIKGESLIVITAPSGTTLEVPDPDQGMEEGKRRYKIYLNSTNGPINVWVLDHLDPFNSVNNTNLHPLDNYGAIDDGLNQVMNWNQPPSEYFLPTSDDPTDLSAGLVYDDLSADFISQDAVDEYYNNLGNIGIYDYYSEDLVPDNPDPPPET
jgi:hypothetical protein